MLENLNVDNVQIHIPKEIDGTDMGTWAWWFVYQNAKREKYSIPMTLEGITNDEGEEEYISTVSLNHGFTGKHGTVMYAIEAVQADGSGAVTHEWHTKTCKMEIVYTLQGNQTEYDESESDIISALISRVNELITSGAEIAEIAETIENAAETAQEVIDSIPSDYSALSDQVDANTAAIALKADQATTYTKTEVDQMIEDVEIETDTTLAISGAPADAKKVGDELSDIKADLGDLSDLETESKTDLVSAINEAARSGLSDEAKEAILDCFRNVAWLNEPDGEESFEALLEAFDMSDFYNTWEWSYPGELVMGKATPAFLAESQTDGILYKNDAATQKIRRFPTVNRGKLKCVESTEVSEDFYPIPIPKEATSVTVTIAPATMGVFLIRWALQGGVYKILGSKLWTDGTSTMSFDAASDTFLSINVRYNSSNAQFTTEPQSLEITFE